MSRSSADSSRPRRGGYARWGWILLITTGLVLVVYAVQRDRQYERTYAGDLRNRVVGARLMKDHQSPYFYKWKTGDPVRYYIPANFDSLKVSVITASPFLHQLLCPLVEWPEDRISKWWLALEYFLLVSMTAVAFWLACTWRQKTAVVIVFLFILLTNAWKQHISFGQSYLFIPFLALLFFVFLPRSMERPASSRGRVQNLLWAAAAGLAASSLVLIRINTILYFIPFLFLLRRLPASWLLAFLLPALLLAAWSLRPSQGKFWKDYLALVEEGTKKSQGGATVQYNEPDPHIREWEGINTIKSFALADSLPDKIYSENGNVFVLYEKVFHRHLSVTTLGITAAVIICLLTGIFFRHHRPFPASIVSLTGYPSAARHSSAAGIPSNASPTGKPSDGLRSSITGLPSGDAGSSVPVHRAVQPDITFFQLGQIAVFGYCLYMISDLFSPVHRHQYYGVQWIFPLLVTACLFSRGKRYTRLAICLLAGLALNSFHFPLLHMGNTLGEYLILASLLGFTLFPAGQTGAKAPPADLS